MSRLPSRRAVGRLAWRDIRRHRAQSLLVLAMIALPVAAMVGAMTLVQTISGTPEQRATAVMGAADLMVVDVAAVPRSADDIVAALPQGSRIVPSTTVDPATLSAAGGRFDVRLTASPVKGLTAGTFRLRAGRFADGPDEVALTTPVLQQVGVAIGDVVTIDALGDVRVVGEVVNAQQRAISAAVTVPGALPPSGRWVVDLPAGTDFDQAAGNAVELGVIPRTTAGNASGSEANVILVLGGFGLVEAGLVVAAAFAVSVRRRQRELGLLAAGGGTPRQLRAAVRWSGAILGTLGATVGAGVGLLAVQLAFPWVRTRSERVISTLIVSPGRITIAVGLGVATAVLAAAVPARGAIRLPVVTALAGRRPTDRPSRRSAGYGVGLIVVGVAIAAVGTSLLTSADLPAWASQTGAPAAVMLGSVVGVVGFGATSPWLLERLGRLAPRLPLGLRLAVRDTGRFRTRNGSVITAIVAGLAASVALGTVIGSFEARNRAAYEPRLRTDQILVNGSRAAEVAGQIASRVETRAVSSLAAAQGEEGPFEGPLEVTADQPGARAGQQGPYQLRVVVGDATTVRALGGGADAVAALDRGEAVVWWPRRDLATLLTVAPPGTGRPRPVDAYAVEPDVGQRQHMLPNTVISPATMRRLGIADSLAPPDQAVVRLAGPITDDIAAQARQLAAETEMTFVEVEQGYTSATAVLGQALLVGAVLTGLAVLAVAVALAAAESHDDQRTLVAVGAAPRVRRDLAAGRAAVLAVVGGVLAVPAGLLPAWGVLATLPSVGLHLWWTPMLVSALGMPVVATAAAWLATRPTPPWTDHRAA